MMPETARSAARVHRFVYARHGRDCYGVQVPCTRLGVSRSSVYQMIAPIDKVRGEGNCGRVTDRGEEARECVRKRRVCIITRFAQIAPGRALTLSPHSYGRKSVCRCFMAESDQLPRRPMMPVHCPPRYRSENQSTHFAIRYP